MIRLLIFPLLFISCKGSSTEFDKAEAISYQVQIREIQPDTLLKGVQEQISNAFAQSMITRNNQGFVTLSNRLEQLYKKKNQSLILYWRAYLQFYSSIYYLKTGDKKAAEKEIDKGIDWLKEMKNKNSEDYALLAMLQGFGIQFKGIQAMFIAGDITKNGKQAIALDPDNLRAYYVYASNDFYTPAKYGGRKEAEKYLLKALSLPVQKVKNSYLPSWGKEESYDLLIKLYIKQEKWELAKKYFQQGIKAFPESYTLNQLAAKLVGK